MMEERWSYVCNSTLEGQEKFAQRFLDEAAVREQPAGTYLCRQGDPAACLYLLLDGVVENSVILEDGRKKINMLYTGMSLLGVSCLDEEVCMVNLRCLTRVRTARVHRQTVRAWPPEMLLLVAMCQTYKMQGVYRQLREQVFLSTEEHLLKILEDLEASGALSGEYGLKRVSHQLLADMAGLSRVQASNLIGRLAARSLLSRTQMEMLRLGGQEVRNDG